MYREVGAGEPTHPTAMFCEHFGSLVIYSGIADMQRESNSFLMILTSGCPQSENIGNFQIQVTSLGLQLFNYTQRKSRTTSPYYFHADGTSSLQVHIKLHRTIMTQTLCGGSKNLKCLTG